MDKPGQIYDLKVYPATLNVLETGQTNLIQVDDPKADKAEVALMREQNVFTNLILPLKTKNRVWGLLEIYEDVESREHTMREIRLAESLAFQAAVALENAQLYEDAQNEIINRKASEVKHRTVMDTCADPLVVYDTKGQVTYLNPAFAEIFGWTSEELLGKRIYFVPDEAVVETQKAIKTVLGGESLTGFEAQRLTKDGRIIDVLIGAALLLDDKGESMGMVVNFQDVTELKKTEAELERIHTQLGF